MAKKRKHASEQEAVIAELRQRIAELETRLKGTSLATWVAAVGTALSGIGSIAKVPPPPAPPAPAVQQYQEPRAAPTHPNDQIPPGTPPHLDYLVEYLDESDIGRNVFVQAVRESGASPWLTYSLDLETAAKIATDVHEPADHRAAAILYLGSQRPERAEELKAKIRKLLEDQAYIAGNPRVVIDSLRVALKMMEEPAVRVPAFGGRDASKEAPVTFRPPLPPRQAE